MYAKHSAHEDVGTILNMLLRACYDSRAAFVKAGQLTPSVKLKMTLTTYAEERQRLARQLAALVLEHDCQPASEGTAFGQQLNAVLDRHVGSDGQLLDTLCGCEAVLKRSYESAIEFGLPLYLYQSIVRQYDETLRTYRHLRLLAAEEAPTAPMPAVTAADIAAADAAADAAAAG